jgi:alkaline phosphatase D
MDRRDFLGSVALMSAATYGVPNSWRVTSRPRLADDPFMLGVGSGDPTPNSVMLWTRLAPKPVEELGGMTGERVNVRWEVAEDEQFSRIVKNGQSVAAPELGMSVHADVDGLTPDRWYFYRFLIANGQSPVGRTRTAPAAGATTPLRFAFASCQQYETGYFTAYQHMAKEGRLDLVAHLGDYIYEYSGYTGGDGRPRKYATAEVRTLDQYRARYAQTKSDKDLIAAHAAAPWVVTWDDHEVDNNDAGLKGENNMESEEQMRIRRAAAYQAWWENQPVRVPRVRSWTDLNITRRVEWGSLATFHVLDTRQYRTDQNCNEGNKDVPCGEWGNPAHTMMGAEQEKWLDAGMAASRARWQVLANQVRIAPYDQKAGDGQRFAMDTWAGYPAALDRLLKTIETRAPNRTVALTGDIHTNWVNELPLKRERPNDTKVAAEFIGTSITSGGDGSDLVTPAQQVLAENPFCKWFNNRRGYCVCEVSSDEWRATYKTVDFVAKPDSPIKTAAQFAVRNGRPGIEKV